MATESTRGAKPEDLERIVPETAPADLVAEHVARYAFAQQFVTGRAVLDVACGSGYGSAMLAERAAQVFGLDLQEEAIVQARARRPGAGHWLIQGDVLSIPGHDEAFDVVVSFETLEHVADPARALAEMRRVLRQDGGLLILSTPNRVIYRDELGNRNPYHVLEPTLDELDAMLRPLFPHYRILGERWNQGVLIGAAGGLAGEARNGGARDPAGPADERAAVERADYFVAVCGFRELPTIESTFHVPDAGNVMLERTRWAQRLEHDVQERTEWAQQLNRELQERTEWAQRLDAERVSLLAVGQELRNELGHLREQHNDLLARHFLVPKPAAVLAALSRRLRRLAGR